MSRTIRVIDMDDPQSAWDALYREIEAGLMDEPRKTEKPPVHPMMDPRAYMHAAMMMQGEDS